MKLTPVLWWTSECPIKAIWPDLNPHHPSLPQTLELKFSAVCKINVYPQSPPLTTGNHTCFHWLFNFVLEQDLRLNRNQLSCQKFWCSWLQQCTRLRDSADCSSEHCLESLRWCTKALYNGKVATVNMHYIETLTKVKHKLTLRSQASSNLLSDFAVGFAAACEFP